MKHLHAAIVAIAPLILLACGGEIEPRLVSTADDARPAPTSPQDAGGPAVVVFVEVRVPFENRDSYSAWNAHKAWCAIQERCGGPAAETCFGGPEDFAGCTPSEAQACVTVLNSGDAFCGVWRDDVPPACDPCF